jgi:hypothetical protein
MCDNSKCDSDRVALVCGKTSDMFQFQYKDIDHDGYVPEGLPIGGKYGDYIDFDFCLECGKIQGNFPVSDETVKKAIEAA